MSVNASPADDAFARYIAADIVTEGGAQYTNDPSDHGGATIWGITEAMARSCGYTGDMRQMTEPFAIGIYRLYFWTQPGFDRINDLAPELAMTLLDLGINLGPGVPSRFLQRSLNVLGSGPAMKVDGQAGAMTRQALADFLAARGAEGRRVLTALIHAMAGVRYVELAEASPSQTRFEFGWLSKRAFPVPAAAVVRA